MSTSARMLLHLFCLQPHQWMHFFASKNYKSLWAHMKPILLQHPKMGPQTYGKTSQTSTERHDMFCFRLFSTGGADLSCQLVRRPVKTELTWAEWDVCAPSALNSGCVHDATPCLTGRCALECRGILDRGPALFSASAPPSQQQKAGQHCSRQQEQWRRAMKKNTGEEQTGYSSPEAQVSQGLTLGKTVQEASTG